MGLPPAPAPGTFNHVKKFHLKRLTYKIRHDYLTLDNVVIFLAGAIAMGWAWGAIQAMQQNYSLQQQLNAKQRQVEIEKLKVSLLEYEIKYHQSAEYQDLAVRQRLGRGTPGEKQLILPSTDQADQATASSATPQSVDGNFQQWINFLFGGRN